MIYSQLRAFHFVAQEGSFTRAAAVLNVTQPTVSMQVKELEARYQTKLFNRRGQRVELTEMGDGLFGITCQIFDLERQAEEFMSASRALEAGQLKVGTDSPIHMAPVIAAFAQRYPGISLSLATGSAGTTLEDLLDYRTDVALVAASFDEDRVESRPFSKDRIVAVIPADHPLSSRSDIRVARLLDEQLVLRERGSATRQIFETAISDLGKALPDFMEIGSREGVQEAIAAGLGVGVVSEAEISADKRIVTVPITNPSLYMTEYLVCLRDRLQLRAVRAFMDVAEENATA
ncbi:MAG: LysR substrate-binding domain-containing protein [Alphaproteobacteria bacterium]|nr:LysR substrate-binding domain-containing protein [Alphaproteobacteria bacterium]